MTFENMQGTALKHGIKWRRDSLKERVARIGLPPGTLPVEQSTGATHLQALFYTANTLRTVEPDATGAFKQQLKRRRGEKLWLRVADADAHVLKKLGDFFELHPLTLEDLHSRDQRPKTDYYENYVVTIVQATRMEAGTIRHYQVALIVGSDFVISVQYNYAELFQPIQERIQVPRGRLRKERSDYLYYALLDLVVDHYFSALSYVEERLEELETRAVGRYQQSIIQKVHALRGDIFHLRRLVIPLREVIRRLEVELPDFFVSKNVIYLRDIYDHIVQVIDRVEVHRELLAGIYDLQLSMANYELNNVMRVLTIISTIFIPLSFIAGVYGMNFDHMPEIHSYYGYPIVLGVMLAIGAGMLAFFRMRKWL